jgi:hypothetical protein
MVFSISSTNKTHRHKITKILLKVALNTIYHQQSNSVNLGYHSSYCFVTDHSHHRSKRNNGLKEITPGDRESCKPGAVGVLIINIIITMKKYRI